MENENANQKRLIQNGFTRNLVLACGFVLTFLALLGAILPLVPTTPFLLAASSCFYRSSPRFYKLIMYNRYFGHYLRDYKEGRGIESRVKIASLAFLWISTLVSVFLFIPYLWLELFVIAITAAVTVHILMIRSRKGGRSAPGAREQ